MELYDQDPHQQEFLGEVLVRVEHLEPERNMELAVDMTRATTGSIFMSVCLTPVKKMIEKKAAEFSAGKLSLAAQSDQGSKGKSAKRSSGSKKMKEKLRKTGIGIMAARKFRKGYDNKNRYECKG